MIIYLSHMFGDSQGDVVRSKLWLQWTFELTRQMNRGLESPYLDHETHVIAPWISLREVVPQMDGNCRHMHRGILTLFTSLGRRRDSGGHPPFSVWAFGPKGDPTRQFELSAGLFLGAEVWDFSRLGDTPFDVIIDPRVMIGAHRLDRTRDIEDGWARLVESDH